MYKRKIILISSFALILALAFSVRMLRGWGNSGDFADQLEDKYNKSLAYSQTGAAAATVIVAQEANHLYSEKTVVKFHPSGLIYIVFDSIDQQTNKRTVSLYKYNGIQATFVKTVSETTLMAYEPDMVIANNGLMHFVWAEGADANANTQYIKYRTFDGSNWSSIITLKTMTIPGTVTGNNDEKVDDVRLAVDGNGNIFVVNTIWMAARCESLSRYNGRVYLETFPSTARSKHASVAVDPNYVHVAWVGLIGSTYYIQYARRDNRPGSAWNLLIPVQSAVGGAVDRPFIRLNNAHVPQLVYLRTNAENTRDIHLRSWRGNGFSEPYVVTKNSPLLYHPPELAAFDNNNMLVFAQTWGRPSRSYYNWYKNGKWSGLTLLGTLPNDNSPYGSCDLNAEGLAAIAYSAGTSIMLAVLESTGPPPDPPAPDDNLPPTAFFSFSPTYGLYPLNVVFNAQNSNDSDGQIVSYHWNFGDGSSGSGVLVAHQYMSAKVFQITLTVTDDDGATAIATGALQVFGVAPPLNVQFQRHVNRNLFSIEYLYRITWNPNPRNEEVGAKIVAYKIYRREIGKGGFGHFYTLQAGNQASYEYLDRTLGSVAREYEYAVSSLDSAGRESDLN